MWKLCAFLYCVLVFSFFIFHWLEWILTLDTVPSAPFAGPALQKSIFRILYLNFSQFFKHQEYYSSRIPGLLLTLVYSVTIYSWVRPNRYHTELKTQAYKVIQTSVPGQLPGEEIVPMASIVLMFVELPEIIWFEQIGMLMFGSFCSP
jgi:TRAP-type C4-dicarboxylate transport system permease large subunit